MHFKLSLLVAPIVFWASISASSADALDSTEIGAQAINSSADSTTLDNSSIDAANLDEIRRLALTGTNDELEKSISKAVAASKDPLVQAAAYATLVSSMRAQHRDVDSASAVEKMSSCMNSAPPLRQPSRKIEPSFDANNKQLQNLRSHVVSIGPNGELAKHGILQSTPEQLDKLVHDAEDFLRGAKAKNHECNLLLFAHGGLTTEQDALRYADQMRTLWMKKEIYPVFFSWRTGLEDLFVGALGRPFTNKTVRSEPNTSAYNSAAKSSGCKNFSNDLSDWIVEQIARILFEGLWKEMKNKALNSFAEGTDRTIDLSVSPVDLSDTAGVAFVSRLKEAVAREPSIKVHLMGHSAGSNFCAALLERLNQQHITVESVTLVAPSITLKNFERYYLTAMRQKKLKHLYLFDLSEQREERDCCTPSNFSLPIYHKSLLYLVSRALESQKVNGHTVDEVPLLGMAKFLKTTESPTKPSVKEIILSDAGAVFLTPPDGQSAMCNSNSHGGFPWDEAMLHTTAKLILSRTSDK